MTHHLIFQGIVGAEACPRYFSCVEGSEIGCRRCFTELCLAPAKDHFLGQQLSP